MRPTDRTRLSRIGTHLLRYGLALVILWIGLFKFTAVEAAGIRPLVEHSPFLGWLYRLLSEQGVSNLFGTVEVMIALAIAARPWVPRVSALGSAGAVVMFLTTLSFLATTPGVWDRAGWMVIPNQFLLKDIVFLGAAVWTGAEAWRAARP